MPDKNAAFMQLDNEVLSAVMDCLRNGLMVVLIGASGSGKSVLAQKALPSARVISGLDGALKSTDVMDSDLIGEELYDRVSPDESIRYRNQALALGYGVIFTGQMWQDVVPHLAGLEQSRYKVFDLNRVWETHGYGYPMANPIPQAVLAN